MKRLSIDELSMIMRNARKSVKPGIWIHKKTRVPYRVKCYNVLNARSTKPMVIYCPLNSSDITWVRPMDEFKQRFIEQDQQNRLDRKD